MGGKGKDKNATNKERLCGVIPGFVIQVLEVGRTRGTD